MERFSRFTYYDTRFFTNTNIYDFALKVKTSEDEIPPFTEYGAVQAGGWTVCSPEAITETGTAD